MKDLFERVEKDKNLGRVDRNSLIDFVNDALSEINNIRSNNISELVDFYDEEYLTLSRNIIKINNVSIGKNEKFIEIDKMRHGSITKFEE